MKKPLLAVAFLAVVCAPVAAVVLPPQATVYGSVTSIDQFTIAGQDGCVIFVSTLGDVSVPVHFYPPQGGNCDSSWINVAVKIEGTLSPWICLDGPGSCSRACVGQFVVVGDTIAPFFPE